MTLGQAKKDLGLRLQSIDVPYERIKGKTVGFEDLARGQAIFLSIVGIDWQALRLIPEKLQAYIALEESRGKGYIIQSQ